LGKSQTIELKGTNAGQNEWNLPYPRNAWVASEPSIRSDADTKKSLNQIIFDVAFFFCCIFFVRKFWVGWESTRQRRTHFEN
jgi:hypothetical protein